MADYDSVRIALGDALRANYRADLNIFDTQPRSLVPPAAIVKPRPHRTIKYNKALGGSDFAEWQFLVLIIIGLVDDVASQRMAGALISPGSPAIRALNTRILNGYAHVVDSGTNQMMIEDSGLYTYAELSVDVLA